MIIGFDLDDVLLDFREGLHAYHNRCYGTDFVKKDFITYNLAEMWGCSKEEERKRVFDFYWSAEHWNLLPVDGAVRGIKNLKQHHSLFVITAKPEELKDKTMAWIDDHFPQMFDGVHFTNQYHGKGLKRTKGEICQELGVGVFIDDSLDNANDVAGCGITTLLFDAPWNQDEVRPPIRRVFSWDEIVKILSKR